MRIALSSVMATQSDTVNEKKKFFVFISDVRSSTFLVQCIRYLR
jgi:hypothetical protein